MSSLTRRQAGLLSLAATAFSGGAARAAGLDTAAVTYLLPDQIKWSPPSSDRCAERGAGGQPVEGRALCANGQMARGQPFQPSASPSARSVYHRAQRHLMGRYRHQIRSQRHRPDARRDVCHALRQTCPFRRRQGRRRRSADCRRRPRNGNAGGDQIVGYAAQAADLAASPAPRAAGRSAVTRLMRSSTESIEATSMRLRPLSLAR